MQTPRVFLAPPSLPRERGSCWPAAQERAAATDWQGLSRLVTSWLLGKVRSRQDAEDLAGEAVVRTWEEFRGLGLGLDWRHVSAWAFRAARNLSIDSWRATARAIVASSQIADTADPRSETSCLVEDLQAFLVKLRACASTAELETLDLLAVGVVSTAELAASRGVGARAVTKVRAGLQAKAVQLWNDSWAVPMFGRPAS